MGVPLQRDTEWEETPPGASSLQLSAGAVWNHFSAVQFFSPTRESRSIKAEGIHRGVQTQSGSVARDIEETAE
jgi:hypothetical protein